MNETVSNCTRKANLQTLHFMYSLYFVFGLIALVANSLILGVIGLSRPLRRREMMLLVGLAVGDGLYGVGFLIAGVRRKILIDTGHIWDCVSPWYCLTVSHTYFFVVGATYARLMLCVISIDRLLAITTPVLYGKLSTGYSLLVNLGPLAYTHVFFAVGVVLSWEMSVDAPPAPRICYSPSAVPALYNKIRSMKSKLLAGTSILLYGLGAVLFFRKTKLLKGVQQTPAIAKRQAKFFKTVSVIIGCTLCLVIIPLISIQATTAMRGIRSYLIPASSILTVINSGIPFFIYMIVNMEFRRCFVSLIKCQKVSTVTPGQTTGAPSQPGMRHG